MEKTDTEIDPSSGLPAGAADNPVRPGVYEILKISLGLGCVGFGGGVSVLALIRTLMVDRRRWLTESEFTSTATVAQMLPGGAGSNALAYVGLKFQGIRGAVAAYAGFVAPGAVVISLLAWFYARFGAIPHAEAFLAGLNAAVVGIIISITVRMLRASVGRLWQMAVSGVALLLVMVGGAGSGEVVLLGIVAGLVWDLGLQRTPVPPFRRRRRKRRPPPPVALPEEGIRMRPAVRDDSDPDDSGNGPMIVGVFLLLAGSPHLVHSLGDLLSLAVVFFRTGLGAYGGGFAVIPSLQGAIHEHGWLTPKQFTDAVAVGKLTPGPVLLMATFIGFLKQGIAGAVVSTIAILSGPFILVVLLARWLDRVRSRRWIRAALRGLTPAVVGLMAGAALTLGRTLHTGAGLAIAGAVALTLVRFEKVNPVMMLALGGITRLVVRAIAHI